MGKSHSSRSRDPLVKLLTLARDLRRRRGRERQRLFVVEGVRAVEELVRSPLTVRGALVSDRLAANARGSLVVEALAASGVETAHVSEEELASAAEAETPQGLVAIAEVPERRIDALSTTVDSRLLVLDAVQDPGNVGTLLRTAAALGVAATIALPGTVDLWNAKVVRGAMGALFHHFAIALTLDELDVFLRAREIPLWAADQHGEPLTGSRVDGPLAIAVGNEGGGLSPAVRERAVRLVALPITSAVESLNVAVAAGILLFELRA